MNVLCDHQLTRRTLVVLPPDEDCAKGGLCRHCWMGNAHDERNGGSVNDAMKEDDIRYHKIDRRGFS